MTCCPYTLTHHVVTTYGADVTMSSTRDNALCDVHHCVDGAHIVCVCMCDPGFQRGDRTGRKQGADRRARGLPGRVTEPPASACTHCCGRRRVDDSHSGGRPGHGQNVKAPCPLRLHLVTQRLIHQVQCGDLSVLCMIFASSTPTPPNTLPNGGRAPGVRPSHPLHH